MCATLHLPKPMRKALFPTLLCTIPSWAAKIAPPDSPAESNSLHDPASWEHSRSHCLQLKLFGDLNCNGQLEPKPIQTGSKKKSPNMKITQ